MVALKTTRKCSMKRSGPSKVVGSSLALVTGVSLLQVTTCLPTNGEPLAPFDLSFSDLWTVIWPLAESFLF